MAQAQGLLGSVGMLYQKRKDLARGQIIQTCQADPIILPDTVVVIGILEGKVQQPLLLQIRFVDAGEAAGDDSGAAQ